MLVGLQWLRRLELTNSGIFNDAKIFTLSKRQTFVTPVRL